MNRVLAGIALALTVAGAALAEPGVTSDQIVIGMSAPLSGSLGRYGVELERGMRAGLAQVNAGGGIQGRQLTLLVKDDAGDPQRAVANTQQLLDAGVLALSGYHGAASIEAVLPLVEQADVPWVGVASSAELLREPPRRTVFNLRAGAREEAAAMVLQLDTVGITDIAAIVQEDALGRAALAGIEVELVRLALKPRAVVRLSRDARAEHIAAAMQSACQATPQALLLALDAQNALAVIRAASKAGCKPQFYVMSEAGAQLASGAASPGELASVIVSQVVPHPGAANSVLVSDYQRQLAAGSPNSHAGLEGYMYARVLGEALRRCGRDLSRRCLVAALESKPVDVGGYRVQFSPKDRRGSRFVEMTILTADGRFRR